jgi:hypothetical protein
MGSLMKSNKHTATSKGTKSVLTIAAGVGLAALATPWIGVPVIGLGLYFGYDWFMFRARHGMRF